MNKIDRLLLKAHGFGFVEPYEDYDYSKLTTPELLELISKDISEERTREIIEPVKFMNTDPDSLRKRYERLSDIAPHKQ